jgi:hypothetical protein
MKLSPKPGESFREEVARVGGVGIVKVVLELAGGANAAKYLPHVEVIDDRNRDTPVSVHQLPRHERFYTEADAVIALEEIVHRQLNALQKS